ncbi:hypothetical protein NMG60_11021264 [Bertholletia excelsa]
MSLRLIGLRLSHFNVDKDNAPSDPTQKTLANFLISPDTSVSGMDSQTLNGADIGIDLLSRDPKAGLPADNHYICCNDFRDMLDSNGISRHSSRCMLTYENVEVDKSDRPLCNIYRGMSSEGEASQLERDSLTLTGYCEESNLCVRKTGPVDDCAVSSLTRTEQSLWVNDYKCRVCGIELPPSFVDERQEHSDFHLAEQLQEEETGSNPRNLSLRQRFIQKDRVTGQSRSKKQKSSAANGKHLPIDMFFIKSNQNF